MREQWSDSSISLREVIRPRGRIAVPETPAQGQTHPSGMAGNSPVSSHRLEIPPPRSWAGGWKTHLQNPWQKAILQVFQPGV